MSKTSFDTYLEEQMKDAAFAERFQQAGAAWDVALQLAALRKKAGLSQKELARQLQTTQQQISRLESPGYEGHSLSMLRRVAHALHAEVRVKFHPVRPKIRGGASDQSLISDQAAQGATLEPVRSS
jgi:transcriptional regulator with XRE-family HTH domain